MSLRTKLHPMGGSLRFIRPNLTSNGTLGGNSFAVTATPNFSSTPAYYAVDSSAKTFWSGGSGTTIFYIFYNPTALNVTEIILTCTNATYSPASVTVMGSNNNSSYTNITSSASGTGTTTVTVTLSNTAYYKYYRLRLTRASNYIYITNMDITATLV